MAINKRNCAAGFEAAGIEPYNPSKTLSSRFIVNHDEQRPTTPVAAGSNQIAGPWDLIMTPATGPHITTALNYLSTSTELNRTIRTIFAKTGKALERSQFELADAQRELRLLRRKAVNPNKSFIALDDIEMGSHGPPVPARPPIAT
ncbi:hypothetical protein LTR70_010234 [Exophiala xenobiotica]|uniref:Uncharacterized protein n=1 Tax=Lithohypha guttulata TaxID=1690604 RepID=A0ABR0JUJ2_9EURO|nr:hypothetical protein LTR24_010242 [Lithohypha guttulata]KAK5309502.1 hypothetical protein LTR70_010234 [Exophiala xenobiotica]